MISTAENCCRIRLSYARKECRGVVKCFEFGVQNFLKVLGDYRISINSKSGSFLLIDIMSLFLLHWRHYE